MANEITLSASLSAFKATCMSSGINRAIANLTRNMTGTSYIQDTLTVTTSELAVPMGGVTGPHWSFWYNNDATNYVKIYDATGQSAHAFVQLLAGDFAIIPMSTSITAPFAQANTASVQMEYLIIAL